jgi:hypothetical protein
MQPEDLVPSSAQPRTQVVGAQCTPADRLVGARSLPVMDDEDPHGNTIAKGRARAAALARPCRRSVL